MSETCDHCGEGPPEDEAMNAIQLVEDEFILGHSFKCPSCDMRLNPLEAMEGEVLEEPDEEDKFLEQDNLSYGME